MALFLARCTDIGIRCAAGKCYVILAKNRLHPASIENKFFFRDCERIKRTTKVLKKETDDRKQYRECSVCVTTPGTCNEREIGRDKRGHGDTNYEYLIPCACLAYPSLPRVTDSNSSQPTRQDPV